MTGIFKVMVLAVATMIGSVATVQAATVDFDLVVEGGETQQVYALENGNFLGLWGFDTRRAITPGGVLTIADLTNSFKPNDVVRGFYFGSNAALNGGASEFDKITGPLTVANGARLVDALWVEWTGGNLTFSANNRTRTMGSGNVTLAGDPFAPAAVPLPAAVWLLLAGLGGLFAVGRRKTAAA